MAPAELGGQTENAPELASANLAHQEERYRAGVALVAGILRQLADEVEGVGPVVDLK